MSEFFDDKDLPRAILAGQIDAARRMPSGGWTRDRPTPPRGLLSGAFNPRHAGHTALRSAAEEWLGIPVDYELSVVNVDKPALTHAELRQRCSQFADAPVVVTRAATFVHKAAILTDTVFVVGADTALRILDEKYYGESDGMSAALRVLRQHRCRFLVACRHIGGRLVTGDDLPTRPEHRDLFELLPVDRFRNDISSSQLRRRSSNL